MMYIKMSIRCARIDEETAEKAITHIIQKLGYSVRAIKNYYGVLMW